MKFSFNYIRRTVLLGLTAASIAGCLSSCIFDDGDCPETAADSDMVTFSFQMISADIGSSRADSHPETGSEWPDFEDLIKRNDFAFYIFAQNSEGAWPMIMSMTDLEHTSETSMTVLGGAGVWMITAALPKAQLEETLGYEIQDSPGQKIPLRVAVIANAGSDSGSGTTKINYNTYIADDFAGFIAKANTIRFLMSNIFSSNQGDASADGLYKGAIPMYGMNEFNVSGLVLRNSTQHDPAWMGNVDMLRALAKIRVKDNIVNKNPQTHLPRIDEVTIESATPQAYVLPPDAADFQGEQSDTPRPDIPAQSEGSTNIYTLKLGRTANYAAPGDSTRIGYIPEQYITDAAPTVRIKVTFETDGPNGQGNPVRQEEYSVPLSGYNGVSFAGNFGAAILRNHIYNLSVDYVSLGAEPDIKAVVSDWTQKVFELDFSNEVGVTKKMEWESGFTGNPLATGEVVMLPWTTSEEGEVAVPLRGTFGISTPVGATWSAYLIAIGENADETAFEFLVKDEAGNYVRQHYATGVIDGENAMTIRIVSTNPSPAQVNKALLQVVVTIGEGTNATVSEAPITPEGSTYSNFTIVQNSN